MLDDNPRKDSVIFTVQLWNPEGAEPETLWQVMGKQKDIQYASRAKSHIARQKQIHHLRHVIREMHKHMPGGPSQIGRGARAQRLGLRHDDARRAPARAHRRRRGSHQGHRFHAGGHSRALAGGYADTMRMLSAAPWTRPVDPIEGVIIHQDPDATRAEARARHRRLFRSDAVGVIASIEP